LWFSQLASVTTRQKVAVRVGLVVAALGLAVGLWKREQVAELTQIGVALVAVQLVTTYLPACDRVEVYHIRDLQYGEKGKAVIPERPSERFILATQGGHTVARVVEQKELLGAEAAAFVRLWRDLQFGAKYSHLCHQPGYGLRFHSGAKVQFDTTLCFECMNFPVGVAGRAGYYGFDARHSSADALLRKLQDLFPASIPRSRVPPTDKPPSALGLSGTCPAVHLS